MGLGALIDPSTLFQEGLLLAGDGLSFLLVPS